MRYILVPPLFFTVWILSLFLSIPSCLVYTPWFGMDPLMPDRKRVSSSPSAPDPLAWSRIMRRIHHTDEWRCVFDVRAFVPSTCTCLVRRFDPFLSRLNGRGFFFLPSSLPAFASFLRFAFEMSALFLRWSWCVCFSGLLFRAMGKWLGVELL